MSEYSDDTNTRHRAAFPGDPAGVRAMRVWLRGSLPDNCPHAADIQVCAAELATNATRHTASGGYLFAVTVERDEVDIRLTVEDLGGDDAPEVTRSDASELDASGHGLALVSALSDAWGSSGDAFGRDIWAVWALE